MADLSDRGGRPRKKLAAVARAIALAAPRSPTPDDDAHHDPDDADGPSPAGHENLPGFARRFIAARRQRDGAHSDAADSLQATQAALHLETDHGTVYLWPDCVQLWQHWLDVQTQWRSGVDGATGLDYTAVRAWLQGAARLRGKALAEALQAIQAAEHATLGVWAQRRLARHKADQAKQAAQRQHAPPPGRLHRR